MKMKIRIRINCIFCIIVFCTGCGILSPKLKSEKLTCCEGSVTFYFPIYNEMNVKYRTDSIGSIAFGIPIRPNDSIGIFHNYLFSKYLCKMGEPILYSKTNQSKNFIRFSHFGSWSSPYSFRMEQNKSKVSISFNKTLGQGNLGDRDIENGTIECGTKEINVKKWNLVIAKMDSIDFWKMETHDKEMILDGEEWVFEALINGRYHLVMRNSPESYNGKEYAELCKLIKQTYTIK